MATSGRGMFRGSGSLPPNPPELSVQDPGRTPPAASRGPQKSHGITPATVTQVPKAQSPWKRSEPPPHLEEGTEGL